MRQPPSSAAVAWKSSSKPSSGVGRTSRRVTSRRPAAGTVRSRAANRSMNRFIKQWLSDDVLTAVQALRPIADEAGITLSQLALAWVLHQPNITSVIVGATRPEQVHENVKAAEVELSPDTLAAIDETLRTAAVS